jgi:hypothetical protein
VARSTRRRWPSCAGIQTRPAAARLFCICAERRIPAIAPAHRPVVASGLARAGLRSSPKTSLYRVSDTPRSFDWAAQPNAGKPARHSKPSHHSKLATAAPIYRVFSVEPKQIPMLRRRTLAPVVAQAVGA